MQDNVAAKRRLALIGTGFRGTGMWGIVILFVAPVPVFVTGKPFTSVKLTPPVTAPKPIENTIPAGS